MEVYGFEIIDGLRKAASNLHCMKAYSEIAFAYYSIHYLKIKTCSDYYYSLSLTAMSSKQLQTLAFPLNNYYKRVRDCETSDAYFLSNFRLIKMFINLNIVLFLCQ